MEKINEIWFYEYSLTAEGITRTFISAVADYTKERAIRAGKRHAAVTAGMTFIGPVKFVREVTESAPKPDADGWIERDPTDPIPDKVTALKFDDGGTVTLCAADKPSDWTPSAWAQTADYRLNITHYHP